MINKFSFKIKSFNNNNNLAAKKNVFVNNCRIKEKKFFFLRLDIFANNF
jgi:hypothetical protein